MGEYLRPDVYVEETAPTPQVVGVGVATAGFIGMAERGPVDEALLVSSIPDFKRKYGWTFSGSYLPQAVEAFFNQGGRRAYIARVVNSGVAASATSGTPASNNAILWTAREEGPAGNDISFELIDPGSPLSSLSVSVSSKKITVSLETDSGSSIVSTASQVISAVSSNDDAAELVTATNYQTSDGSGIVATVSETSLSGGSGAAYANGAVADHDGTEHSIRITARDPGQAGNLLSYTIVKASTESTADLENGDTSVTVASTIDFEIGDLVKIDDGTTSVFVYVTSISASAKTFSFPAVTLGSTISSGATVSTIFTHRFASAISTAIADGDDRIDADRVTGAVAGQRILITDGSTVGTAVIDRISGNTIFFTSAISLSSGIASGSPIVSLSFPLTVYDSGEEVESFTYLSIEDTDPDWVETRLYGDANESDYVQVQDLDSANADVAKGHPGPVGTAVYLSGGDDGGTATDSAYKGSSDPISSKYLFENVSVNFFCTPGVTTAAVTQDAIAWAENQGDTVYICSAPLAADTVEEVIEYKERTLNVDSSYGALYYPWLRIQDPDNSSLTVDMPPDGWVAGVYSRVASERGVHKAPANIALSGVVGLTHNTTDGEHDILNPKNINAIRAFEGRGIRVFGARTLTSLSDTRRFVNVRRTLNFIKESVKGGLQFGIFETIDDELFSTLFLAIDSFLNGLWRQGMLVPGDDPTKAYFVRVDEETTPPSVQANGEVYVEVGVAIAVPAEKIIVRIGAFAGQVTLSESLV